MGWNDYPLRQIVLPADHAPGDPFIYIGPSPSTMPDSTLNVASLQFNFGDDTGVSASIQSSGGVKTFNLASVYHTADGVGYDFDSLLRITNPILSTATKGLFSIGPFSPDYNFEIVANALTITAQSDIIVNGAGLQYGVLSSALLTASGAAITAETVFVTIASQSYAPNRAYRVRLEGGFTPSTVTAYADVRLKKTSTAGQTLGEFYRFPTAGVAGVPASLQGSRVFQVGNSTVTGSLVLTIQTPTGTVTPFATVTSPFTVTVQDAGPAAKFPNAPTLV